MPMISITSGPLKPEVRERLLKELTALSSQITGIPSEYFFISISELSDDNIAIKGKTVTELKKS